MKRQLILCLITAFAIVPARAALGDDNAEIAALKERIASLEKRIAALEKHVAELEKAKPETPVAKPSSEEARAARRAMFTKRMQADSKKYSTAQFREAEELYQVANKDWSSPQAKANLEKMIAKFPDLNRTGCAILYLGQMSQGADREKYLKLAIDKHADSMYGDGVVVGAYARYYLAQHYAQAGEKKKAKATYQEILDKYPDAVDHSGHLLAPQVEVLMKD